MWRLVIYALLLTVQLAAFQSNFDELSQRGIAESDTDPQQAVADCREALSLRPDWVEGWLYMGASLFKLGRFSEARDALRKGATLEPNKGTPLAFLGMAEYELGDYQHALPDLLNGEKIGLAENAAFIAAVRYRVALIFLQSSEFPQAMEQLRLLVKTGANSQSVTEALGLCVLHMNSTPEKLPLSQEPLAKAAGEAASAYETGQLDKAAKLFKQLTTKFPYSPWVHYLNGINLIHEDPNAAEKEFRQEVQISPRNALAYGQLAAVLLQQNHAVEAVKEAQKAVQLRPSDAWCRTILGRAQFSAGQVGEAIATLETARQLAPEAALPHFYLAQAYRREGKMNEAQSEQTEWNRLRAQKDPENLLHPTSTESQNHEEQATNQTDLDTVIRQWRNAVAISPDNGAANGMLAWFLIQDGEFDEAARYAEKAEQLAPDSAVSEYVYGRLLVHKGDLDEGIKHLEKAGKLAPNDIMNHTALAVAYAKARRPQDARRERQISLQLAEMGGTKQ